MGIGQVTELKRFGNGDESNGFGVKLVGELV